MWGYGDGTNHGCLGRSIKLDEDWNFASKIFTTGYSLDGESLPEDELAPYIQIAIDQINFVIGDPATNEYGMSDSS